MPDAVRTGMFSEVDLETAEQLVEELSPETGRLWQQENARGSINEWDWVFRGQADASWGLKPSALRPASLRDFFPNSPVEGPADPKERAEMEHSAVLNFASEISHRGLEVPYDRPELRDRDSERPVDAANFPALDYLGMYALAQHYGVPTRLLDWSRNALVAAYFGCREVAGWGTEPSRPTRFAIWALSYGFVNDVLAKRTPSVKVVTVPTHSNPNLHAQAGLFSLVGSTLPPVVPDDLDEILRQPGKDGMPPALWKFTLPAREARTLLRFLALRGMTAATVKPGHAGVVDALKERRWHQRADPGERS